MTKIEKKNLKCNQCDYKTDNIKYLRNHMKSHKKSSEKLRKLPNAIKCEKCPSVLSNEKNYRKHLRRQHLKKEKFQCNLCGLEWKAEISLKLHLELKHSNTKI